VPTPAEQADPQLYADHMGQVCVPSPLLRGCWVYARIDENERCRYWLVVPPLPAQFIADKLHVPYVDKGLRSAGHPTPPHPRHPLPMPTPRALCGIFWSLIVAPLLAQTRVLPRSEKLVLHGILSGRLTWDEGMAELAKVRAHRAAQGPIPSPDEIARAIATPSRPREFLPVATATATAGPDVHQAATTVLPAAAATTATATATATALDRTGADEEAYVKAKHER